MKAIVDRRYSQFYARQTGELLSDYDILKHEFQVEQALKPTGKVSGYRLVDCNGNIHPFVPTEFVTIIDAQA